MLRQPPPPHHPRRRCDPPAYDLEPARDVDRRAALAGLAGVLLAPIAGCAGLTPGHAGTPAARTQGASSAGASAGLPAAASSGPQADASRPLTTLALGNPQDSSLPTLSPAQRERLREGRLSKLELEWPMDELLPLAREYEPGIPPLDHPPRPAGRVRLLQGKLGFELGGVFHATGKLQQLGAERTQVCAWGVMLDLLPGPEVLKPTTRDRVCELVCRLDRLGWKRYIPLDQPRLAGVQALRYKLEGRHGSLPLDPGWMPDAAQWREVAGMQPRWQWVANGMHLEVAVLELAILGSPSLRRPEEIMPKMGYSTQVVVSTELEYLGIPPWPAQAARSRLEQLRRGDLPRYRQERRAAEAGVRRRGGRILDSYRDPPLPRLG